MNGFSGWLWWAVTSIGSFFLGTVAGTIGGIVGERLWRKAEGRPRLRITTAFQFLVSDQGLLFTVTNCGSEPLPRFKLGIYSPDFGSLYMFPIAPESLHRPQIDGFLLPDQQQQFLAVWLNDGNPTSFLTPLASKHPTPTTSFRVVMENTDQKVLFESPRMGRAILAVASRVAKDRSFVGISPAGTPEMNELRAEPQGTVAWIWGRIRGRTIPVHEA